MVAPTPGGYPGARFARGSSLLANALPDYGTIGTGNVVLATSPTITGASLATPNFTGGAWTLDGVAWGGLTLGSNYIRRPDAGNGIQIGNGTTVFNNTQYNFKNNADTATFIGISSAGVAFSGSSSGTTTVTATAAASGTLTLPAATDTLVGKATTDELTNKTLTASVGKGTWTNSGTWILPAHTWGGTISGGGNQLNNVVVGATTPLAGTFTALTATGNSIAFNSNTPTLAFGTSGNVDANFTTTGVGRFLFLATGSSYALVLTTVATGGNYLDIQNSTASNPIQIKAAGGATVPIGFSSAGAADVNFYTNSSANLQVAFQHTASVVRNLILTGAAAGGNPTINVSAGNLAITPAVVCASSISATTLSGTGVHAAYTGTATPAAASAVAGLTMGSANVGIYWGTGDPAFTAPKGSLYIKTDATTITTRLWINTNAGTTWAFFTSST